jgi:phage shock protein A
MLATTATAALAPKFGAPTKIASARSTFASGAKPVAALRVTSAGASARLSRKDRAARLVVSANLFNRLGRVIGSYANSLVSAAEDPEKILDQTVIEMQEDLVKMRQASAQVIASQKQLENKYKQAQATADDWYRRAELAMSKGDEELAREALSRKKSYQDNADSMKANLAEQEKAVEKLIANTRFLESKMAEAKSKKDTLKARAASAKTNKAVQDLVSGVSTSSALSAFEKMEEKVMGMEAEAEAVGMLTASNDLEDKFKALEGGGVDDDLAALKSKMLGDGEKKGGALPEGRPVSDAIESELEALRKKANDM